MNVNICETLCTRPRNSEISSVSSDRLYILHNIDRMCYFYCEMGRTDGKPLCSDRIDNGNAKIVRIILQYYKITTQSRAVGTIIIIIIIMFNANAFEFRRIPGKTHSSVCLTRAHGRYYYIQLYIPCNHISHDYYDTVVQSIQLLVGNYLQLSN